MYSMGFAEPISKDAVRQTLSAVRWVIFFSSRFCAVIDSAHVCSCTGERLPWGSHGRRFCGRDRSWAWGWVYRSSSQRIILPHHLDCPRLCWLGQRSGILEPEVVPRPECLHADRIPTTSEPPCLGVLKRGGRLQMADILFGATRNARGGGEQGLLVGLNRPSSVGAVAPRNA